MATIDYNDLFINKLNKVCVYEKVDLSITMLVCKYSVRNGSDHEGDRYGYLGGRRWTIIGASIVVAGTTTGTVTDYNGAFTLDVPSNAKKLIVSYIGMKSVEVAVKPIIKVTMESDSQNLDEVVVVGYGTQRKKDVTSAISKVGGEELKQLGNSVFRHSISRTCRWCTGYDS